jgi:hypothetical protein
LPRKTDEEKIKAISDITDYLVRKGYDQQDACTVLARCIGHTAKVLKQIEKDKEVVK